MPGLTILFVENTMQEISNHPEKFKGVMACDVFLSYMKNSIKLSPKDCFIINLSSSGHRGSHFICIFLNTSTSAEYFDPFGIESFNKNINKAMNHYGRFGLIFFQFQVLLVYLALQKLQNRNEKYKRNLSDVCQSWGNALRFILYT